MQGQDPQELGDPWEDQGAQCRPPCDPGVGMFCGVSDPWSLDRPCGFAGSWLLGESCYPGVAWVPVAAHQPRPPIPHLSCPPTQAWYPLPLCAPRSPLGLPLPRPSPSVSCVLWTLSLLVTFSCPSSLGAGVCPSASLVARLAEPRWAAELLCSGDPPLLPSCDPPRGCPLTLGPRLLPLAPYSQAEPGEPSLHLGTQMSPVRPPWLQPTEPGEPLQATGGRLRLGPCATGTTAVQWAHCWCMTLPST